MTTTWPPVSAVAGWFPWVPSVVETELPPPPTPAERREALGFQKWKRIPVAAGQTFGEAPDQLTAIERLSTRSHWLFRCPAGHEVRRMSHWVVREHHTGCPECRAGGRESAARAVRRTG